MNPVNDGGPAFPISPVGTGDPRDGMSAGSSGMSLRDWFAGQALQQFVDQRDMNIWAHERYESSRNEIAKAAYNIADAMLAARNRGKL